MRRIGLLIASSAAIAYAQFRESGLPGLAAHVEVSTGAPARVYLLKDGRPFRLSPVDSLLPLAVDLFYRERLWRRTERPATLEVTCHDESHFILLDGRARFDLPPGRYRLEAYRGFFFRPASADFELGPGENRRVELALAPSGKEGWLSGDDHIHLTRGPEDDDVFVRWLEAEDLTVGNFLQLQRQSDAAVQYAFGPRGEARRGGYTIRPGQESRSEFYGHVNLLGGRELLRPLSIGAVYANSPPAYPFPYVLFEQGRKLGATVGYAHFDGSQKHSTLLMDLALGSLDFIEVFQFGVLKMDPWYELLNAGLRVTGIAGSDFPVGLGRRRPWPHAVPLLGPERTLVPSKRDAAPYEAWAEGIRAGRAVVTNGPLLELRVAGREPGATLDVESAESSATASFHRPIEKLEIVANGRVVASAAGDGKRTELALTFRVPTPESTWIAARVQAAREPEEPEVRAHTNPVYVLRSGRPVRIESAREAVLKRWRAEADYYRSGGLTFARDADRRELLAKVDAALAALAK